MMPSRFAHGRANGCRPKRNGNTPREGPMGEFIRGAIRTNPKNLTVKRAAFATRCSLVRIRQERARSDSTIWLAMYGNGPQIGIKRIRVVPLLNSLAKNFA